MKSYKTREKKPRDEGNGKMLVKEYERSVIGMSKFWRSKVQPDDDN